MKLILDLDDETVDALATAIAGKITINGNGTEAVEDDDFAGGTTTAPPEITLSEMQDAAREAVGKFTKDKVKALVKKVAGVDKVADIPKDKYQAVMDALKKLK